MRIAKYIAQAGICSRRDAEKLIEAKKVFINNILCKHPSTLVNIKDNIIVNKKKIKIIQSLRLWKLYKPIKTICTNKDPQKRKTIFDIISLKSDRLISVGRLDYMSEGLILLTNNGNYARKLELPSSNIIRVYRICIRNKTNKSELIKINSGIKIDNINYKKVQVKIEKYKFPYTWLIFKMKEGKNREIRKIANFFSWNIVKLIRIQYGSIKLQSQKPGEIIEVKNLPKL